MYGVWLSKQTAGTCATRRALARIQGCDDDRCPNCLVGPERHTHLNQCLDPGRSLLFEKDVEDLHQWMSKNTDPELRYWIRYYLILRGECTMAALGEMPPAMAEVAAGFDTIGWVDIMHGRLPLALLRYQTTYCRSVHSRMTGKDWMRQFTTRILNISHAQWAYRNFSLHNKSQGYLRQAHQADVLTEIASLSERRPEDVPEGSRFLLEVDMVNLDSASLAQQEYWIAAMKAALSAGRRCARPRRRQSPQPPTTSRLELTSKQQRDAHRFRRRIHQLLHQMREDLDLSYGAWRTKRPCPTPNATTNGSNKRFRKPD